MPSDLELLGRLLTLVSAYGFGRAAEPSRVASQVVAGIGFLGGGAIVRHGLSVRGLTAAASIWAAASTGVAVGVGSYLLAVGGTVMIIDTLCGLRALDRHLWLRSEPRR